MSIKYLNDLRIWGDFEKSFLNGIEMGRSWPVQEFANTDSGNQL